MIIQNRIISKTFVEMISDEKTVLSCVDWQITGEGPQERGVRVHKGREGGGLRNQVTHTIKTVRADFRKGKYWWTTFQQRKQELYKEKLLFY